MSKRPVTYGSLVGGWSGDIKSGAPGTFFYSRGIDFRKSASQLSVLPGAQKETGTTVTGLVTELIQLPSGKLVAIDSSGGVYTRTTGGTWAKSGTTLSSTAFGMVYNEQKDIIYIPGNYVIHTITNADGRFSGGTFTVNESAIAQIIDKSSSAGHAQTYTALSAISEAAVDKLGLTPTIEPAYSVKLWVASKGTAPVTLTMHDQANNVLATVTVPAASLTNGAFYEFVFTTPVRMLAKPNPANYHFHITFGSGTTTTFGTSVASDFSTADYQEYAHRLVRPNNGFHPCAEYLQYILIGNGRYVAVWEPITETPTVLEFLQHRITFPNGYEVTSMALLNEFIGFACEKRSTNATSEFQEGKIFLWDGTATTYNTIIDVPEGAPYGLFSHRNTLWWFANGGLWASNGGNPVKVFQMPKTDFEFTNSATYMVNYPHTMTVRNSVLMMAWPSETNNVQIEHGIYSYGRRDKNFPDSFGFSYPISTGNLTNTSTTLRVGMVKSFGDKMFFSWRDGSNYGVDKIDTGSPAAASASIEMMINDTVFGSGSSQQKRPDKDKLGVFYKAVLAALPSGVTVTPKYKIDRAASWTYGDAAGTGLKEAIVQINERYKEVQVGFDITTTGTSPEVLSSMLLVETLAEEAE